VQCATRCDLIASLCIAFSNLRFSGIRQFADVSELAWNRFRNVPLEGGIRRRGPARRAGSSRSKAGFEPSESVEFTTIHVDSRTNDLTRVDVSAREVVAFGPMKTGDFGGVEDALARAIAQASVVGQWDIVAQLARELEARRLAAVSVRSSVDELARRPGQE